MAPFLTLRSSEPIRRRHDCVCCEYPWCTGMTLTSADLFLWATFRLEFDESLGDLVVCSLWKDAEYGPSGLIQVDSATNITRVKNKQTKCVNIKYWRIFLRWLAGTGVLVMGDVQDMTDRSKKDIKGTLHSIRIYLVFCCSASNIIYGTVMTGTVGNFYKNTPGYPSQTPRETRRATTKISWDSSQFRNCKGGWTFCCGHFGSTLQELSWLPTCFLPNLNVALQMRWLFDGTIPSSEREPASAAALFDDVLELHDGHPDQFILASEAVILTADVQLVTLRLILVTKDTAMLKQNLAPFVRERTYWHLDSIRCSFEKVVSKE